MGLEFARLFDQVETMGSYLAHRSESTAEKLALALTWLEAACDLDPVYERIGRVRSSSISGYRGAAPLNGPFGEIVCGVGDCPPPPSPVVLVAADGSQVYPNPHGQMLYYLTNISLFSYAVGLAQGPMQETYAALVYSEDKLRDKDGRPINNKT
ncbi:MAG TPA: hypothetical protein VER79_14540, partial [Candidatus Limnocylindrales bacterium]|nr:hypothetical protein [Candidatus Limnocylindrales bacterium]